MSFKRVLLGSIFAAMFMFGAISVSAQMTHIKGKVYTKDENGKESPVEGVKIECYRVDIVQSCRDTQTDKFGEFTFLGIPFSAKVILGVSGPGIEPTVVAEQKAGTDDIHVLVTAGDGRSITEEEVRASAASVITGELTEEQKKEQAEIERKNKEIDAFNQKAKGTDEARAKYDKEGKEAFETARSAFGGKQYADAKTNYDIAAEKFKLGYEVDTEFIGAAPGFLISKAASDRMRSKSLYFATEATKRNLIQAELAKGYGDSITALSLAYKISQSALDAGVPLPEVYNAARKAEIKKNLETNVAQIKTALKETFVEINSLKLNPLMFSGTDEENQARMEVYKTCYKIDENDLDVFAGYVIALFSWADITYENSRYQTAINYGAQYLKIADNKHSQWEAINGVVTDYSANLKLKAQPIN